MFNLDPTENRTQVFNYTGNWEPWRKPDNASLIFITCIGGGGGGGGGRDGGAGNATAGAGGGAGSAVVTTVFIASMLPDILYVNVGSGGSGGTARASGGVGQLSYVSLQPNTSTFNLVCVSGAAPTGGGALAASVVAGPGGVGNATPTEINSVFLGMSVVSGNAGPDGAAGAAYNGANGVSLTGLTNTITCGGTGGGSCTAGGGGFSGGTIFFKIDSNQKLVGGYGTGRGNDGITLNNPFYSLGGSGGGGITSGAAGSGSNGGIGSGGGGSGSGATVTKGGEGGHGIVIIKTM